jgi:hypothetical protein
MDARKECLKYLICSDGVLPCRNKRLNFSFGEVKPRRYRIELRRALSTELFKVDAADEELEVATIPFTS